MAGRERMRLTDRAIARLRPREREYTVWDNHFVGLGVRVRPTGGRSYVLLEDTGGRSRRVSLGPVSLKTVAEVRRECHARKAEPEATCAPRRVAPLFRDFVEGAWKEAHFEGYKPSTRKGVRSLLDRQLLPAFGSKPLDRITLAHITRWFDRFSWTAPGNANHALDLLTQIINFAIARGHLETNTARAVKRNRRQTLTRFLSREEISRLHTVLARQPRHGSREQADIIRLLLLTGCRRSEILRLRWSEVDRDRLVLADGKTGPRIVATQYPGPAHSRRPTARRKPLRICLPDRSHPAPQPQPCVLASRQARGSHRGRSPSRSPAYPCQPRSDERRAGAGGRPPARPFRCPNDPALRPSRGPRNRASGREGRASHRSSLAQLECSFADAWGMTSLQRRQCARPRLQATRDAG